nr:hypothetical protein [Lacticaseibacillus manihotivorans]
MSTKDSAKQIYDAVGGEKKYQLLDPLCHALAVSLK